MTRLRCCFDWRELVVRNLVLRTVAGRRFTTLFDKQCTCKQYHKHNEVVYVLLIRVQTSVAKERQTIGHVCF